MKLAKIAVGIMVISIVCLAAGPAMAIELKLGHYAPESHPAHQAALMMAKGVEERTNGEVTIKIYPANHTRRRQRSSRTANERRGRPQPADPTDARQVR